MEIPVPQASPDVSTIILDQLAEKFSHLLISDSTRIQEVTINHDALVGEMAAIENPTLDQQ